MTQPSDNPTSGGSYVRDPKTGALTQREEPGALTRVEETAPSIAASVPVAPAAPAKATERKSAPSKSAVETKE